LTFTGIKTAFTSQVMTHWQPLTVMSHMLDVTIFGMNSGAHHGVNLLIHTINAVLLFYLLRSTTQEFWTSAFVTIIWTLHPLHVENVAWVSDRKDLLCTFFGLMALHAYTRFVRNKRMYWYILVMLLYCVGMLCKSMIVTLPIMCLALDCWPLQRLTWARKEDGETVNADPGIEIKGNHMLRKTWSALLVEKIPLLVLMTGFCALTYITTQRGGFLEYYGRLTVVGRLASSVCSHVWYILMTLCPQGLAATYIHPDLPGGTPLKAWQIVGALFSLITISWVVWRWRRPYLIMGWFWFLCTLAPVNGLVQYGNISRADRNMYIPMIGLLVMLAWGMKDLFKFFRVASNRIAKYSVAAVAGIAIVTLASACWIQCGYWRNSIRFYERQVELAPSNPFYCSNLADEYLHIADYERAIHYANRALVIWPRVHQAHDVLANVYTRQGHGELARHHRNKNAEIRATVDKEHADVWQ